MPKYEYTCKRCKWEGDKIATLSARDQQECLCGGALDRTEISLPSNPIIAEDLYGAYVGKDMKYVPGRFGESAKNKRKKQK